MGDKTKHTPGPWVIIPPAPFEGDDECEAGGFVYPGGIEGDNGDPVCMFGDPSGSGTMFENAANARLIAAAPEMLDALTALIAEHDNTYDGEPMTGEKAVALDAARAAIAKAVQS